MNFARVFTGLDYNIRRGNIEHTDGRNRTDVGGMAAGVRNQEQKAIHV